MNGRTKNILMVLAVVVSVYILFNLGGDKSRYTITEREYQPLDGGMPQSITVQAPKSGSSCGMQNGTGLASSLIPREIASGEDFGQFAPDDILAGQSYLEPRQQIGFPETIGGALRNANRTVRADPPNPKQAYVWNNTTIVPDTMQRGLCA